MSKIFEVEIEARYTALVSADSHDQALAMSKDLQNMIMSDDPWPETYHTAIEIGRDAWDSIKGEALYGEFQDVKALIEYIDSMKDDGRIPRCPLTIDLFGGQDAQE